MGNSSSTPAHTSIYAKLLQIQSPQIKVQMIQTLFAAPEYVAAARAAGLYSQLLNYVARVNAGDTPPLLPGERGATPMQQQQTSTQLTTTGAQSEKPPAEYLMKGRRSEKAMTYFQNCLLVLGLEEEVALNEEALRQAYKRAAVKAHPDKGGSEQAFEAVTRAHAYLGEIIRRIQGGRSKEGKVEAPNTLKDSRATEATEWQHVQPVRLNPKKLDVNAFNQMFEQTRIPDPDDEGYGDWLKAGDASSSATGPKFGGKFNRDVFNRMFEEESRKAKSGSALAVMQPEALTLAVNHGVELGRGASGDYTAAANASVKYTDLKQAYTSYNTFSGQVAGVNVENRSFDAYTSSRKAAPAPLTDHELAALQAAERAVEQRERGRQTRAAQEMVQADEYFKRMKQLVLTDGPGTNGSTARGTALDQQEKHRRLLR